MRSRRNYRGRLFVAVLATAFLLIAGVAHADIFLGPGNDTWTGNDGNNTVYGQGGDDYIYGRGGNDNLYAGPGFDNLYGNDGYGDYLDVASNDYDGVDGGPGGGDTCDVDYGQDATFACEILRYR